MRRPGQLDAIAMHNEGHRRTTDIGADESIERLAGDPPRITAVRDHPGSIPMPGAFAQGLADGGGDHHPEAPAVQLGPSRQPRHVSGDIEPASEALDNRTLLDEAKRRQTGIVADAGVGVFDGVFDALVIGHRQGQQQRRYEIEAASQMVELADLGQGGQTPDGGAVFSSSSISWAGSLSHNGYDNNVSKITENVLKRFLDPTPF